MNRIIALLLISTFFLSSAFAQQNTSERSSYRYAVNGLIPEDSSFRTIPDNGYVVLLDGNRLEGKINISGPTFEEIAKVTLKADNGKKYYFQTRSLTSYGLDKKNKNQTPDKFRWHTPERNAFSGMATKRVGEGSYGYVTTESGKKIKGAIQINEIGGVVKYIYIKDHNDKKHKFLVKNLQNYGVEEYQDPKFEGVFSAIKWKSSTYLSAFNSKIKSVSAKGAITMNNGNVINDFIQVVKKGDQVVELNALTSGKKGKALTVDYNDVKKYAFKVTKAEFEKEQADKYYLESIHPTKKFHKGYIVMSNGDKPMEGWVAKTDMDDYGDLYFTTGENSLIKTIRGGDVEFFKQNIAPEEFDTYEKYWYEVEHVDGIKKDLNPKWDYKNYSSTNQYYYTTNEQYGYVKLKDGKVDKGMIVVKSSTPYVYKVIVRQPGVKKGVTYSNKVIEEYGLLIHEPVTYFPNFVFNIKKQKGYLNLNDGRRVEGLLTIKNITGENIVNSNVEIINETEFILIKEGNKTVYKPGEVDEYGLIDCPVSILTNYGTVLHNDQKANFQKGSFKLNGQQKSGEIALVKALDGTYPALFFAENGIVNLYKIDNSISDVKQDLGNTDIQITTISKLKGEVLTDNGFLITKEGKRLDGNITLRFAKKMWFAKEVEIVLSDGQKKTYKNDGSLEEIVIRPGLEDEQKFIRFENEYVEVLNENNGWYHFKNPHPTTRKASSAFASYLVGAAVNNLRDYAKQEAYEYATKNNNTVLDQAVGAYASSSSVDYMNVDFFVSYHDEHIFYNPSKKRKCMYIPNKEYNEVKGELMGSLVFLKTPRNIRRGLFKVRNSEATISFLGESFKQEL